MQPVVLEQQYYIVLLHASSLCTCTGILLIEAIQRYPNVHGLLHLKPCRRLWDTHFRLATLQYPDFQVVRRRLLRSRSISMGPAILSYPAMADMREMEGFGATEYEQ